MSTDTTTAIMRGSCACGANTFGVTACVPMQRFYCHCLYCQQFTGNPYIDVTFVRAKNVVVHAEHATFANPKLLPPGFTHGRGSRFGHPDRGRFAKCANLDRARCDECGEPFAETIGGSVGMVFIPSGNFQRQYGCRQCSGTSTTAAWSRCRRRTAEAPLLRRQPTAILGMISRLFRPVDHPVAGLSSIGRTVDRKLV